MRRLLAMQQVIDTTQDGAQISPEQLADAGVAPGQRAVVDVRAYTEADWMAEADGKILSTDEFIAHLRRAPADQ